MTTAQPRALVAGLGLIGGSIGMALRARGWRVSYLDPHVELDAARRAGAADERLDEIGRDADVVIIATPVRAAIDLVHNTTAGLTTSVCSVMAPLRSAATSAQRFVAGHPMAGSQEHGLAAARAELFTGRRWFVDRDESIVAKVIADCGAIADRVDAEAHDRAVALTSHLPQLLSTALGALIDEHPEAERFSGTGLSTFLRLAGSDASIWSPIFEANRENVSGAVEELMAIVRKILEGDEESFARAQRALKKLNPR